MTIAPRPDWRSSCISAAADRLLERFAALSRAEARLAARAEVAAMLRCLGGNSPYLSDLALRESGALARFIAEGPATTVTTAMTALSQVDPAARRGVVAAAMPQ